MNLLSDASVSLYPIVLKWEITQGPIRNVASFCFNLSVVVWRIWIKRDAFLGKLLNSETHFKQKQQATNHYLSSKTSLLVR